MADMKSTVGTTVGLYEAKMDSSASVSSGADSKIKRIVVADQIATLTDRVIANERLAASYGEEQHEKCDRLMDMCAQMKDSVDIHIMEVENRVAREATSSGNRYELSEPISSARILAIEEECNSDLKRRSTGYSNRAEEMYAVLPRPQIINLDSQRSAQSATHMMTFDTLQRTAPSNDELSGVFEDMDCEDSRGNDGRMGIGDRQGSSSILGDFSTTAGNVEQDSVVDPSSLILASQHSSRTENPDTLVVGSGTNLRSHLSSVQNTGSSSLAVEPTAILVAAGQRETQHGLMRMPSYTITTGRMEVLDSKAVRSATACEGKSMTSPIISVSFHVDAAIFADDAIIGFAVKRTQSHPVENDLAVNTGIEADADQIVTAASNQYHIVVVSSNRMWDPGGYNRANYSRVHTARSCVITPVTNKPSGYTVFRQ